MNFFKHIKTGKLYSLFSIVNRAGKSSGKRFVIYSSLEDVKDKNNESIIIIKKGTFWIREEDDFNENFKKEI